MSIVFFIMSLVIGYVLGAFAFSQIIGSIQYFRIRGLFLTLFTTILWVLLLLFVTWLMHKFLNSYIIAYYFGLTITLLMTLSAGKIE